MEILLAVVELNYPVVVRPSFTMGGLGSGIAFDEAELRQIAGAGLRHSPTSEVLLEESILGWKEYELEVMRDNKDNVVIVCSIENLDPMGVHTGDSITVAPAMTLTDVEYQKLRDLSMGIIREVGVDTGGCNIQFAVNPANGRIIVIEMNPRVSRSSALASKATGFPIAKIATKLAIGFDKSVTTMQFTQSNSWISAFNINFAVGIDGISLVLILLSTILVPIVVLATWHESDGGRWSIKTFYVLILILETMMIGVFAATDLFLFYVFFEAMLIPVYFLIGGYGSANRSAAAVKFLLYSLFGGLLMLASIIGVYVISGNQIGATFDLTQLATLEIDNQTENFLFLGFFIAFAIKAPLWPFHKQQGSGRAIRSSASRQPRASPHDPPH